MFRTAFMLLLPCSTVLMSILVLATLPFDRRERWFDRWWHLWGKLWLWSAGVRSTR